jgi:hypothetical protein
VTETPESYQENDLVNIAPGSSLPGYSTGGIMDLVAWVPGEALLKTTYFRVFMRYDTPQKLLFRKLTDLSAQLVTKLDNMLTPAK